MVHDPNNFWEQLERLEKLIKASELKAGVIFSFHSLVIGLFMERIEYFRPAFEQSILFSVVVLLWALSVLISVFFSFKCFMPRMESKYEKNVFFFRDTVYSFGDVDEYTEKLSEVCRDEDQLFRQLSQQIHVESKIIDKKFSSVQKSIKFFALSFIFIILSLLTWLIIV